jgi:3-oxoacyl-[acyl-carrier-protein] synthase-3
MLERREDSSVVSHANDSLHAERTRHIGEDVTPGHPSSMTERRQHKREILTIPFSLRHQDAEISGHSRDISSSGLALQCKTGLESGTPLALKCTFGEIGYLNLVGQIVFCQSVEDGSSVIGIKFSALRGWEQKILDSAIQELLLNSTTVEKSLLTIHVSEDTMALEAASFYARSQTPRSDKARPAHTSCIHASKIIGWGGFLPPNEITNQDVNSMLRVGGHRTRFGEVVGSLTGIQSRHYTSSKVFPSDLAVEASRIALKQAGVTPQDIDVIVSCGVARDVEEPATAYIIQEKLGARNAYSFDLANACNGFISAIDVVDSFIATGRCEIGLVAVGDVLSQFVTWEARSKKDLHMSSMSYTFGDGGGAVVIQRAQKGDVRGIRARWFLSDSSYWKVAVIPLMETPKRLFKSNAAEIERAALEHVPGGVETVLDMLQWTIDDVDLFIPHQVSSQIIENLFYKRLNVPKEKVYWSFPHHGNVGAASMPVALHGAWNEGRLKLGDKVLLVGGSGGFGAGVIGMIL